MKQFRISLLAGVSLAALTLSTSALATPILTADVGAEAAGVSATHQPSGNNSSTYQGDSAFVFAAGSDASAYAFANAAGAYAVRTDASGEKAFSNAAASFTYSLTNNSSVAQRYSMSFHIYGGYLSTSSSLLLSGTDYLAASYKAEVTAKKVTLFSSGIDILNKGGVITETSTGSTLLDPADTDQDGVYSWGSADFAVDLGVLAAGDSLEFTARVTTSSVSDVSASTVDCGGIEYPATRMAVSLVMDEPICFTGRAGAFYGDPVDFDSSPTQEQPGAFSITGTPVSNDVPEPGALALVGLALAGLALQRRRPRG